ncbi:hypothetical protein QN224_25075 [Sinorhizobium sp. 8-89]|nr:hypothetical protein [Sinorhizobium sp. 7-81]
MLIQRKYNSATTEAETVLMITRMPDFRRDVLAAALLSGVLYGTPVPAQELQKLSGIAMLTGTCERLVMGGDNLSGLCGGKVVQSIYSTGRTGFTVVMGEKGAVTFSGIEGAKPDADTQLQSLDGIILNLGIEGTPPSSQAVTGSCTYGNPFKGPATISCQGVDANKEEYLLQFTSDGAPPIMRYFDQE